MSNVTSRLRIINHNPRSGKSITISNPLLLISCWLTPGKPCKWTINAAKGGEQWTSRLVAITNDARTALIRVVANWRILDELLDNKPRSRLISSTRTPLWESTYLVSVESVAPKYHNNWDTVTNLGWQLYATAGEACSHLVLPPNSTPSRPHRFLQYVTNSSSF